MKKTLLQDSRFAASRGALISLALVLITLAAYWQVGQFDFVHYDDDRYVFQNPRVLTGLKPENIVWAFQTLHTGNWHPLTWLSLMADAQLFGLNAGGYHLVNLLFHLLNILLLYSVLRMTTGSVWRSAAVASLFALHPLHVESVAWVAERKDVLCTFFLLLTLLAYARYAKTPGYKTYLPVVLCFTLGLLAKPMVVTLPFVLLLMDCWPLKRLAIGVGAKPAKSEGNPAAKSIGGLLYEKLPLFALTAGSILVTLLAQRAEIVAMQRLPIPLRISNALVSYCDYLLKTPWPIPLAILYPHPEGIPPWQAIAAAVILLTITALAARTARSRPYLLVGWLWYLGTLVPVIGIIQVGVQSMADRYTYIPLIGIFIAAVWLLSEWTSRPGYQKYALPTLWLATAAFLFTVTQAQLEHWRNSEALFSHALAVTKNNYVMHTNMGALLAIRGNLPGAISQYGEALKIRPDDLEANYNLGNLLLRQGKFGEAIPFYGAAIRSKPDFAPARNNLGIALGQNGEQERALDQFREAVRLDPGYQEARNNLKIALARLEKTKEPILPKPPAEAAKTGDTLRQGVPVTADAQLKAGIALVEKGDLAGAIDRFKAALKRDPNHYDANVHLGLSLAHQRNFDEAIPLFRKAIQINPKRVEIYNSLGVALANTGKIDEAISQLKKAIKLDPHFAKAHNSLGVILAKSGKIEEGLSHLQEAVRLQPDYPEAKKNLEIMQGIKGRD
ncbi:MAG: tetratricopeptide repeat protein [Syntrophales bacterium]|nr:tetratricopeptide repeat protein [Syntrophales bacterium]